MLVICYWFKAQEFFIGLELVLTVKIRKYIIYCKVVCICWNYLEVKKKKFGPRFFQDNAATSANEYSSGATSKMMVLMYDGCFPPLEILALHL